MIDTMLAAKAIEHNLYPVTRNVKDIGPAGAIVFGPWNDNQRNSRCIRRRPR